MAPRRIEFKCGHYGWGAYCHRCKQADDLMKFAPAGKVDKVLAAEVARLRQVPGLPEAQTKPIKETP